jgi:multidrug efflux system membrane fusion protein
MSESPLPPGAEDPAGSTARAGRKSARGWLWFVLVTALASGGYYFYERHQAQTLAAKQEAGSKKGFGKGLGGPTPVVALPARKGPINVYLDGLGTVTPLRTVTVRSRVEGQLMRVHFEEGEQVKQGQLLAEIDPRPFEVLLKQAEGQLARDRALLANARLDVERYRTLLAQDSIAKQQVDAQEALVRQYEGIVQSDQGQIDSARLQLTYARITAPITGRVGLRQVDPGNIVRGSDPNGIVVIAQLAPIGVLFTVPQDSLPALMKRTRADERLPVEAWDREQKTRLAQGRLVAVDNLVDVATGTIKLKAQFGNDHNELFPNQFVNVRLKLETLEDQTFISQSAVQRGGRGLFVYVVKEDMTVTARPVVLGPSDGPRVSVVKGIEPGERVVVDGIDRLREGTRVALAKRPEFKSSVDGGSPRKKGKGKGKSAAGTPAAGAAPTDSPARAAEPAAATAGTEAGSAATGGEAAADAAGKTERRSAAKDQTTEAAPEKSSVAAGSEEPPKKKRRRKPPPEGQDAAGAPSPP